MGDNAKYSSFKSQQIITENFRRFINEDDRYEGEYDQAAARGAGSIFADEQDIIDFIRNKESGTLENNSGVVIVDITNLGDNDAWKVLSDKGIFDGVEDYGVSGPDEIGRALQSWINDRGLTDDGDIDYGAL